LGQSKANTRQRHALDPAAVAEAQLHGPGGARRRIDWEEFALHAIHSARFEMSASTTCTRTTRSSEEPADSTYAAYWKASCEPVPQALDGLATIHSRFTEGFDTRIPCRFRSNETPPAC
jgi:hypothetical protein